MPQTMVFTNEFGKPLHHFAVYSHLKTILSSCGMEDFTFHSLRHPFATISIENGDDIKTVQANLGHHAIRKEKLIASLEAAE